MIEVIGFDDFSSTFLKRPVFLNLKAPGSDKLRKQGQRSVWLMKAFSAFSTSTPLWCSYSFHCFRTVYGVTVLQQNVRFVNYHTSTRVVPRLWVVWATSYKKMLLGRLGTRISGSNAKCLLKEACLFKSPNVRHCYRSICCQLIALSSAVDFARNTLWTYQYETFIVWSRLCTEHHAAPPVHLVCRWHQHSSISTLCNS